MKDDLFRRRDASLVETPEIATRCCCTDAAEYSCVHGERTTQPFVPCVPAMQVSGVATCTGSEYLSRRKGRYQRRREKRVAARLKRAIAIGTLTDVFSFHKMYYYGKKCCNAVRWKNSVQRFEAHLFSGTAKRRREVLEDSYKWHKCTHFMLRERGKIRPIDAPHIQDRQVQKTLTKEVLLPLYEPLMIWNNGASLQGKGSEFSVGELKKDLRQHFRRYGLAGYIIITDCKSFFPNASHRIIFARHQSLLCDVRIKNLLDAVVTAQGWTRGLPLGIEPSQMEMICYPSLLDNYIKCQLSLRGAGHYMDDYYILVPPDRNPQELLQLIRSKAIENELILSMNKTHIIPFGKPFRFCKAKYMISATGRIIVHGSRETAKRCRRKLRAFYTRIKAGAMTFMDLWASFQSVITYYRKTNDHERLLSLFRRFYAIYGFSGEKIENYKEQMYAVCSA